MRIVDMDVSYSSDLARFGYTDDGHEFIGEAYYIQVTDNVGNRWILDRRFAGVIVHYDDECGQHFEDVRPAVKEFCEKLVEKIRQHGKIDLSLWRQGHPVYGSRAYVAYGQAEDLRLEMQEG